MANSLSAYFLCSFYDSQLEDSLIATKYQWCNASKQNVSYGGNGGVNCNCVFSRVQWHLKGLSFDCQMENGKTLRKRENDLHHNCLAWTKMCPVLVASSQPSWCTVAFIHFIVRVKVGSKIQSLRPLTFADRILSSEYASCLTPT